MVIVTDKQRTILRERNINFSTFKMVVSALLTPNDITEDQWVSYYQDFIDQISERDWIIESKSPIEKFAEEYFIEWDIEHTNCELRSRKDPKEGWVTITNLNNTLPEQGFEVLGFNKEWIDPDYNLDGIRVCYMQDLLDPNDNRIWVMAAWCGYHDKWHTLSTDDKFEEGQIPRSAPTHWRNKPEPPVE